jgi:hypothetical protein
MFSKSLRKLEIGAHGENLKRLILFVTILSGYPGTGTPGDWTRYGSRSNLSKPSKTESFSPPKYTVVLYNI